jgi:hypothetical protein
MQNALWLYEWFIDETESCIDSVLLHQSSQPESEKSAGPLFARSA